MLVERHDRSHSAPLKADLDAPPRGIRIYPPRVYLFVDTERKKTRLVYAPDFRRAYDVRPRTFLAEQSLELRLTDGQLESIALEQDTTAFAKFLGDAVEAGAAAAGVAVSSTSIDGTFGLEEGIWVLGDDGRWGRAR